MEPGGTNRQHNPQFVSHKVIASGKWLSLHEITYKDETGTQRLWESTTRTTKLKDIPDSVGVLCVLRRTLKYDCLVCVRQYRPPLNATTIEFPAGLVDDGETVEQAALRELKEETGYVATVKHVSPGTSLDAGSEDSTIVIVTAEIDGDDPVNIKPQPNPHEGENIEVLILPTDDLLEKLNEYANKGDIVDSRVYTYAIAMAQAHKQPKYEPVQK